MQQHWISATEDSALVIEKSSLRQAADLHGRDLQRKMNWLGKGTQTVKKKGDGSGKMLSEDKSQ